jgi:membrane protease YdiL (CAAX protease family)
MVPTFYTNPKEPERPASPLLPDPKTARDRFSRIGLGLTVLMTVMMVMALVIKTAIVSLAPQYATAWWMSWVLSLVPLYAAAVPCLYLVLKNVPVMPHHTRYTAPDGQIREKPRFHLGHWTVLLVIALGCLYVGSLLGSGLMWVMSRLVGYDYANPLGGMMDQAPLWMVLVGACVCAPFGEELIFRKLLLDRVRGFGEAPAIILSGLLFALFHGNLFQLFYAFVLGMILAYVYLRSGKYLWCVAMHAAINFIGSVVPTVLTPYLPTDPEATLTAAQILVTRLMNAWIFGFIIAAIVLLCLLWPTRKLAGGLDPRSTVKSLGGMLGNAGMIALTAVMLLLTVANLIPPQ